MFVDIVLVVELQMDDYKPVRQLLYFHLKMFALPKNT